VSSPATEVSTDGDIATLPEGWALTHIGDVCEINPAKPPIDALAVDAPVSFVPMPAVDAVEGAITAPQTKGFGEVRKGFTSFRNNDVIMAKITPCMENGKAAIASNLTNGLGFGSTEFHVLRPTKAVLSEYIYTFIRQESYRRAAESEMTGSVGQKRVPQSFVEMTQLPLPPLAEQLRIVQKVIELLNVIKGSSERLKRVPLVVKRFRQTVLTAACSGRLTEDWRRRNHATIGSWQDVCMGEVADLRLGKMLDRAKNVGTPTLYLRNINLRWFGFDLTDLFQMRATPQDKRELSIKDGDLLICEGGEPGRCAVWNLGAKDVIFQKALHRVRLKHEISPHWVTFNLKNDADAGALEEYIIGSSIKHMTGRSLATYSFRLPPLLEQLEIVHKVEALFKFADAIEGHVSLAAVRTHEIEQAILKKAFRGELVPTEAELARREGRDYEPASVLLEGIKQQREAEKMTMPKRRTRTSEAKVAIATV
jgi:type I restriction enzyme S subunit